MVAGAEGDMCARHVLGRYFGDDYRTLLLYHPLTAFLLPPALILACLKACGW